MVSLQFFNVYFLHGLQCVFITQILKKMFYLSLQRETINEKLKHSSPQNSLQIRIIFFCTFGIVYKELREIILFLYRMIYFYFFKVFFSSIGPLRFVCCFSHRTV